MAISDLEELVVRSTFIFTGSVDSPASSAVKVLPPRPGLAVVRFDNALRVNPVLGNLSGKPITVLLAGGATVRPRDKYVFFAESWVHAENIAVREFGHLPDTEQTEQQVRSIVADFPRMHLQERVASATAIVSGTVARVERASDIREPVTEHAAKWMRAFIVATKILKGEALAERREFVVFFPSSHDRAWRGWPRLTKGESAVFLIHVLTPAPMRLPAGALLLPDPADVQPQDALSTIQKMLGSSP